MSIYTTDLPPLHDRAVDAAIAMLAFDHFQDVRRDRPKLTQAYSYIFLPNLGTLEGVIFRYNGIGR